MRFIYYEVLRLISCLKNCSERRTTLRFQRRNFVQPCCKKVHPIITESSVANRGLVAQAACLLLIYPVLEGLLSNDLQAGSPHYRG